MLTMNKKMEARNESNMTYRLHFNEEGHVDHLFGIPVLTYEGNYIVAAEGLKTMADLVYIGANTAGYKLLCDRAMGSDVDELWTDSLKSNGCQAILVPDWWFRSGIFAHPFKSKTITLAISRLVAQVILLTNIPRSLAEIDEMINFFGRFMGDKSKKNFEVALMSIINAHLGIGGGDEGDSISSYVAIEAIAEFIAALLNDSSPKNVATAYDKFMKPITKHATKIYKESIKDVKKANKASKKTHQWFKKAVNDVTVSDAELAQIAAASEKATDSDKK